jgi:hypothetical protein
MKRKNLVEYKIKRSKHKLSCESETCSHSSETIPKINMKDDINLSDLIKLGKLYNCKNFLSYNNINLRVLNKILPHLIELDGMIGMNLIKKQITSNILFLLRGLGGSACDECSDCEANISCVTKPKEMFHTVIYGPPGVGKTIFAQILGKIYLGCGALSTDNFIMVGRADLVSGYLGKTAKKTKKVIKKSLGGVLFIDEAYALGNSHEIDAYSKECIDTLNLELSTQRDFICIIAGYELELEQNFFKINPGLKRRFQFTYTMDIYTSDELYQILMKKILDENWSVQNTLYLHTTIKKYYDKFVNYGGDMEKLFLFMKIAHGTNFNQTKLKFISNSEIDLAIQHFL